MSIFNYINNFKNLYLFLLNFKKDIFIYNLTEIFLIYLKYLFTIKIKYYIYYFQLLINLFQLILYLYREL